MKVLPLISHWSGSKNNLRQRTGWSPTSNLIISSGRGEGGTVRKRKVSIASGKSCSERGVPPFSKQEREETGDVQGRQCGKVEGKSGEELCWYQ